MGKGEFKIGEEKKGTEKKREGGGSRGRIKMTIHSRERGICTEGGRCIRKEGEVRGKNVGIKGEKSRKKIAKPTYPK